MSKEYFPVAVLCAACDRSGYIAHVLSKQAIFHGCSNHSNLEMEAECLTKKLVTLEFKNLQNKKWKKQAVKNTTIRKSYRTY